MNSYPKGQTVRFSAAFTVSAVATDPTAVTLKTKDPAGTIATYTYALGELTKDSTGNYHKDIALATAGIWHYRWEGTGPAAGVEEAALSVETGAF